MVCNEPFSYKCSSTYDKKNKNMLDLINISSTYMNILNEH